MAFAVLLAASGCRSMTKQVTWSPNQAVLPWAEFQGNQVTVHNVRNTTYRSADDYTVHHYDKTYDLEKLDTVDFVMVPLQEVPGGAHTFLSFGFANEDYVAVSVEVRRKEGEEFDIMQSLRKPYPLMYVVGDERDLIQLRTIHWLEDVYMYQAKATPEQVRALFVDVMKRANKLRTEPENYHVVTNNCTTNIVRHVNNISPGAIPYGYNVLFPAYSDRLAYHLNLIQMDGSFDRTKQEARINEVAYIYRNDPQFSAQIRANAGPALARRPRSLAEGVGAGVGR